MNTKTTIRKITFIALWLCIGGGMLTLLLAAISKKNKGVCKDYSIVLKGAEHNLFIDAKDVEKIVMKATGGNIKGEPIASFKLNELEQALKNNTWISAAEIYFDNRDVLHITITEKEPVARVFTNSGNSFYLDSASNRMPLSDKLSARVPVFTGFSGGKKLNTADSAVLKNITGLANYILKDSFWMAQVAQIDITEDKNFEMVPTVGNHTVKLGNGEEPAKKFRKLLMFYKQVLSKTGFDKYKTIDVQYEGQVVTSKNGDGSKLDSIQLKNNIQKLIKQSAQSDTAAKRVQPIIKLETDDKDEPDVELQEKAVTDLEQQNPNPVKATVPKTNERRNETAPKPNREQPKPKAVMPKRSTTTSGEDRGYN